nr:MAG TPA: hypothetical protein [Caudoviricetes sp.]
MKQLKSCFFHTHLPWTGVIMPTAGDATPDTKA